MTKEKYISPIAIDLGAKNTGVYFAHYSEGSSLSKIERAGKVYQLDEKGYTLLMANRTAARHQRRGYDRRQMAKRLFKLIWEKHFKLPWDKDVQQTISFLLNRRGFSFLTEEYDAEILSRFPQEAYDKLPDEFKKIDPNANNKDEYNFAGKITEWTGKGVEKVKGKFDTINKEPKRIMQRLVFIGRTKKLKEYCESRKEGNKIDESDKEKIKLSKLPKWILEEWHKENVERLPPAPSDSKVVDLVFHLNKQDPEAAQTILDSLPDVSKEEKELKNSCWNFKPENFKRSTSITNHPATER